MMEWVERKLCIREYQEVEKPMEGSLVEEDLCYTLSDSLRDVKGFNKRYTKIPKRGESKLDHTGKKITSRPGNLKSCNNDQKEGN